MSSEFNQKIGQRLRHARELAHMKQDGIAIELGVSRATVSRYESGQLNINVDVIKAYSDCLNMPVSQLLDLSDNDSITMLGWYADMSETYKRATRKVVAALYDDYIETRDGKPGSTVQRLKKIEEESRIIDEDEGKKKELEKHLKDNDYIWLHQHYPGTFNLKYVREAKAAESLTEQINAMIQAEKKNNQA